MKHIQALSVFMIISMGLIIPGCDTFCGKCYCNNKDARELPLNDTFQMSFGEDYCNPENSFVLTFDSLYGDSRCPIGVNCIWGGNARVHFTLEDKKEGNSEFVLNTSNGFLTDTTIHGFHFELIDLDPYPIIDVDYNQEVYTAIVLISE
jgi:hypothetical protein